jgi:hypothetical protein
MQAPPPTGCTGKAPPAGDGCADVTPDEALIALVRGSPAPPTPSPAARMKATPPHTAAVLPLRFVTTPNCSFSSRGAHGLAVVRDRSMRGPLTQCGSHSRRCHRTPVPVPVAPSLGPTNAGWPPR